MNLDYLVNKDIDSRLEELLRLKAEVKPMVKRIEELNAWCKLRGTFCTTEYVCSVEKRTRTGLVSMDEAVSILTREVIEKMGLSRTSEFLLVHVSKKE